jgi:hypothetical protein
MKVETHAPCALFFEEHDHNRRIGVGIVEDDTRVEQLLNNFLNFILLGKGMMIQEDIGRNTGQN